MRTSSSKSRAFTLIEVVFALAVAVVSLVSILSIMRIAIGSDGDADRDTTVVAMTNHVMNELRAVPFDALWADDPRTARGAAPATTGAPAETRFYFSQDGAPLEASETKNNFDAQYECVVRKTPDPLTRSVGTSGRYNLLLLEMQFTWPIGQANNTKTQNRKVIHASIARY